MWRDYNKKRFRTVASARYIIVQEVCAQKIVRQMWVVVFHSVNERKKKALIMLFKISTQSVTGGNSSFPSFWELRPRLNPGVCLTASSKSRYQRRRQDDKCGTWLTLAGLPLSGSASQSHWKYFVYSSCYQELNSGYSVQNEPNQGLFNLIFSWGGGDLGAGLVWSHNTDPVAGHEPEKNTKRPSLTACCSLKPCPKSQLSVAVPHCSRCVRHAYKQPLC